MQREKNMTKTFKFVIATILFLTLFFIVKNVDAQVKCKTVKDCPIRRNRKYYCLFGICKYDVM
ncbi:late nodulin [Medicago truncatula]|uniref:Late nodulin n=1 Tax=Medicago truncatula TaxID=3880 RepID=G7LCP0_MEDTR|nr:late nodulin [Medicago truncatula]